MRISPVESRRIPEQGSSSQGKSGPKLRPKGVGDGQQVEIPVLPIDVIREVLTQKERKSVRMEKYVQMCRSIIEANPDGQKAKA